MRVFHQRVDLLRPDGQHLKYIPGAQAQSMVADGRAEIHNENGKVKSIRLLESAQTHGQCIGQPSDWNLGVRFAVKEKLDCGAVVWKHHPRCRDYEY